MIETYRMSQIKKEMKELADGLYCTEQGHIEADKLLAELLRLLGYDELIDNYESMRKWYA